MVAQRSKESPGDCLAAFMNVACAGVWVVVTFLQPLVPCSCLLTAWWSWAAWCSSVTNQLPPLLFPSSLSWVVGGSFWLCQSPKPIEQQGPLLPAAWGYPAALSSPTPAAGALPLTGRRNGAQCHTPLQEEVRHHAAVQTYLSRGLAHPPRRTRNATLSAHAGPQDCVRTGCWIQPPTRGGVQPPVMSAGLLGPSCCPIILVWFDLTLGFRPPAAPLGFSVSLGLLCCSRNSLSSLLTWKGLHCPSALDCDGPEAVLALSAGQQQCPFAALVISLQDHVPGRLGSLSLLLSPVP